MPTILITGSKGLIGSHLKRILQNTDYKIIEYDNAYERSDSRYGCILDKDNLTKKAVECDGVVHLAAVSRVIWGEQNPELCERTNHMATKDIVEAVVNSPKKPWFIYASSREVYGEQSTLPVSEDCQLQPMNVYAHTKVHSENLVSEAIQAGLVACTVRFSNVFGGVEDHVDRVIPAFCRGALGNKELKIEGRKNIFDFTFIDDVVRGLASVIDHLEQQKTSLPPIHFTTGKGTTLGEAADLIVQKANSSSQLVEKPSRNFDVSRFYGSPKRAKELLNWEAKYAFEQGVDEYLSRLKSHIDLHGLAA